MRIHHPRWAVVFVVVLVAAAFGEFPNQSMAQNSDDDGHSYLHFTIGAQTLMNFGRKPGVSKGRLAGRIF